jgi:radical SAM protein with 4Fe4S-binding SPASM domain
VDEIVLFVPTEQTQQAQGLHTLGQRVQIRELTRRSSAIDARVRIGRAWNLLAWRGGAGQWTVFDEEYHPAAIAQASAAAFDGQGAEHVLVVHSHGIFLDVELTSALLHHHLHKNHEMRVTYTPAAPGLSGLVLRADIVNEMGEKQVMPWQLLGYDPKAPTFDTLIREACMQVDPALSKIPNRFCADTRRSWDICQELSARSIVSLAELCHAAARCIAPGVTDLSHTYDWPREVEIELASRRLTAPAPIPSGDLAILSPAQWVEWLQRQPLCDDLLLTFAGLGDPLLYDPGLLEILRAARQSGALSICVQTDLAGGDVDGLFTAISEGLVDVISVTMYGHTAETYAKVAGADLHAAVMKNMERLSEITRSRAGIPLVVPRLLKVRETIPELEPFFDFWIERCGWAVIDGPTDRAGSVAFQGVVDMAPPKRKACRRLWDRLLIRADGCAVPCDQDIHNVQSVGSISQLSIQQIWTALQKLRNMHAAGEWQSISPCTTCREWHRP